MSASRMNVPSRRKATWLGLLAPVALAWLGGCSAGVATPDGQSTGGSGSTTGGAGNTGGGTVMASPQCATTPHPGRAPVRRLTRFEYSNAARDLFGDTS